MNLAPIELKLAFGPQAPGPHWSLTNTVCFFIESNADISLEKRDCTFWKWQSNSFKMVCVTYILDKNYGFYRQKCTDLSLRTVCFCL